MIPVTTQIQLSLINLPVFLFEYVKHHLLPGSVSCMDFRALNLLIY